MNDEANLIKEELEQRGTGNLKPYTERPYLSWSVSKLLRRLSEIEGGEL